ncbi:MAG: hypothetical protein AB3N16_00635 [Flavobacteriaceae bacterium]
MRLERVNLHQKLLDLRGVSPEEALSQVLGPLGIDSGQWPPKDAGARTPIHTHNFFDLDLVETDRIFHLRDIQKICIDYRLRFLDAKHFKGGIPQEAWERIALLERRHGTRLGGFKIVAPSKLFKLEDKDDPLLFVPMGNGYFYLVHKWGNDLHPLRKWMMWPFKDAMNLVIVLLFASYVLAALVPQGMFTKNPADSHFWILFLFFFKGLVAIVVFYGFALGKNFSPAIWNSKYFN